MSDVPPALIGHDRTRADHVGALVLLATVLAARPASSETGGDAPSSTADAGTDAPSDGLSIAVDPWAEPLLPAAAPARPATAPAPHPRRQNPSSRRDPYTAWFTFGAGPGHVDSSGGVGGRVGFTVGYESQIFRVRVGGVGETHCLLCDGPQPDNTDADVAILYGVKLRGRRFLALASIGAAAMWTTQRGDTLLWTESKGFFGSVDHYNAIERFSVGVTGEVGIYLGSRAFGIGPTLWFDSSWVETSGAILIDIHIGDLGVPD